MSNKTYMYINPAIESLKEDYHRIIKKYKKGYENRTLTREEESELFRAIRNLNKIS